MTIRIRTEVVRDLRRQRGWTQEEFAEATRLHSRTVQRAETEGAVSMRTFKAIASTLEVETHELEFRTDKIDFGPVFMELNILMLAITRRLMPLDDRQLPNSLVALFAVLSFSASFTLINTIILISQSETQMLTYQSLSIFALALAFSAFFAGIVYPLFKLKAWARISMLGICWVFLVINLGLLGGELIAGADARNLSASLKYVINLAVTLWMYRLLTRQDICRLYNRQDSQEPGIR
jgi:transcriptional regulator with XRE-family HTH domain